LKIFKYRTFHQWAKKEKISDLDLKNAVDEIERGLITANLGSGLYKQRVARKRQGKRSGFRTILAFKKADRTFFLYVFAKNERDNISHKEELVYKKLAGYYLEISALKLEFLIENGELYEVKHNEKDK
jgi:hypothetical protein